jgi:hypothetical protein
MATASPFFSLTYFACFSDVLQQKDEQYGRWFASLWPAHWIKATFLASLPSEGLVILPFLAISSICTFVMTFGFP